MPSEAENWPAGYAKIVLPETDSTMLEASRRAADLTAPTWILALRQTAARGRRGRVWVNPEGNFSATLILPRPGSPLEAAQRSFVVALALYETLAALTDPKRVSLKWPNDVLVDERKIAGILLEAHGAGPTHLAIGIGVNLVAAPAASQIEARAVAPIALAEVIDAPVPEAFLTRLATAYAHEELAFQTHGFDRIRRGWLTHAARLGETITARAGNSETTGVFTDVDKDGQLVLETPEGRVTIPAADVYF